MKPSDLRDKLKGVIAFPITPFSADDSINVEGLHRNLQPVLRQPVAAVVAAAGTGELYSLTPAEHLAVVKTVVEEVNGRVPVIAGAGFNPAIAAQLAKQAGVEKIDAGPKGGTIAFRGNQFANPLKLIQFINQHAGSMKVRPDQKIVVTRDWPTPEDRLGGAKALLTQLARLAA